MVSPPGLRDRLFLSLCLSALNSLYISPPLFIFPPPLPTYLTKNVIRFRRPERETRAPRVYCTAHFFPATDVGIVFVLTRHVSGASGRVVAEADTSGGKSDASSALCLKGWWLAAGRVVWHSALSALCCVASGCLGVAPLLDEACSLPLPLSLSLPLLRAPLLVDEARSLPLSLSPSLSPLCVSDPPSRNLRVSEAILLDGVMISRRRILCLRPLRGRMCTNLAGSG